MTIFKFVGDDFRRLEHRNRHRFFDAQISLRVFAQRHDLQFPIAKVRLLTGVLRQTKIMLDHESSPAFVLMPVFPNRNLEFISHRAQVFASEKIDSTNGFMPIEGLGGDEEERH